MRNKPFLKFYNGVLSSFDVNSLTRTQTFKKLQRATKTDVSCVFIYIITYLYFSFIVFSKGLSGITKAVKGLGAGFHQPVENVRYVPTADHVRLQQRERDILNYAKTKGFHAVSTFNMTISRYRDFLEGNCACHFHKVCYFKNLLHLCISFSTLLRQRDLPRFLYLGFQLICFEENFELM